MSRHSSAQATVVAWLTDLNDLCTAKGEQKLALTLLGRYATVLLEDFPAAAFTKRSLAAVAVQVGSFPSVGTLHGAIGVWWAANRPASHLALEGVDMAALSPEGRGWVNLWHRRLAEWGTLPISEALEARKASLATLIARECPEAARALSMAPERTSGSAWTAERKAEWSDVPTVRRAIASLRAAGWPQDGVLLLRALLTKWAPDHAGMLEAVLDGRGLPEAPAPSRAAEPLKPSIPDPAPAPPLGEQTERAPLYDAHYNPDEEAFV